MAKDNEIVTSAEATAGLRRRAEDELEKREETNASTLEDAETMRLINELQVHQIELEMQNEELRRTREELDESLERYTDLYEFAPAGYFSLVRDGTICAANLTGASLLGVDRSRLIGRRFLNFVTEENRTPFSAFLEKVFSTESKESGEIAIMREGNQPLFLQMEARACAGGRECRIALVDITDKVKLEEQLRQSQKLEAIGTLAGGVAHDFNNILMTIIGYGSLAKQRMSPEDPKQVLIDHILSSADRVAHLTKGLLAFSRKQLLDTKPVEINEIVNSLAKLLIRLIGEDIELTTRLAKGDLIVMADSSQIEQILMNLAANARDAMPDGGYLFITTEETFPEEDFIKSQGLPFSGKFALISVSDTGHGMDEETREKIFEPFFTTKEVGKGTGLGLAIAYGIVKQHNGAITAYSEKGKGTTFRIYLPLISAMVAESGTGTDPAPRGGGETILLVEDDPIVRTLIRSVLTDSGYHVLEAVDGKEAIEKFSRHAKEIDLLLLDVIMPKKSGMEVYNAAKAAHPEIKALFISGYTADILERKGIFEENLQFVAKPLTPQDLLGKIRGIFDKK
jgi:PAS domain S-box-containing protein